MDSILIRPAKLIDLEAINRLETEAFGAYGYPLFVSRQLFDVHGELMFVAVHSSQEIIGVCIGAQSAQHPQAWILSLVVAQHYQRCGYGKQLVGHMLTHYAANGVDEVRLTVDPTKNQVIRLYERQGFRQINAEPAYFGVDESRIVMAIKRGINY